MHRIKENRQELYPEYPTGDLYPHYPCLKKKLLTLSWATQNGHCERSEAIPGTARKDCFAKERLAVTID